MYSKENLGITNIASKTSIKPALSCIAFYGDRTIATDSVRLIEISADGEKKDTPTLYHAALVKAVKLKKEEMITEAQLGITPTDEAYPDVDSVIDPAFKDTNKVWARCNAKLLGGTLIEASKAGATLIEIGIDKDGQVKPILIKSYGQQAKKNVRAIVMPLTK